MQTARTSPAGSGLECPWERGREQLCHQGQPGTATSLQAEQGSGAALASPGAAPGARGSFPHTVHKSLPCRSSAFTFPRLSRLSVLEELVHSFPGTSPSHSFWHKPVHKPGTGSYREYLQHMGCYCCSCDTPALASTQNTPHKPVSLC